MPLEILLMFFDDEVFGSINFPVKYAHIIFFHNLRLSKIEL